MKIGIVTSYDELNFGAFLQAYSLMKYVKSLGHDVEFINYKSWKYRRNEFVLTYLTSDIIYLYNLLKKTIKFKKVHKQLNISRRFSTIDSINNEDYDCIIFGSDEIWNIRTCIGVADKYYFGCGINKPKISYAASFGSTSHVNEVPLYFQKCLKEFFSISVRDQNSKELLNRMGIEPVTVVLDPTFLIDPPVERVSIMNPYIFYYCVKRDESLDSELAQLSHQLGIDVISFGYKHKFFQNVIALDPFEWLGYLQRAQFVVTDMFHGLIFSLRLKKHFVINISGYRKNKIMHLIKLFNLEHRIYKRGELKRAYETPVDEDSIAAVSNAQTVLSKAFLNLSLSEVV